jgi:hypothetical protein
VREAHKDFRHATLEASGVSRPPAFGCTSTELRGLVGVLATQALYASLLGDVEDAVSEAADGERPQSDADQEERPMRLPSVRARRSRTSTT